MNNNKIELQVRISSNDLRKIYQECVKQQVRNVKLAKMIVSDEDLEEDLEFLLNLFAVNTFNSFMDRLDNLAESEDEEECQSLN